MSTRDKFVNDIHVFLRRHKMAPTRLGEAIEDRALMTRLTKGRSVSLEKMDKVYAFMAEYNRAHPTRRASARAA